jgi:hypothetical protein
MFSAAKTSAPSGSYSLSRSLRFRSSASAYLNRTPASASNRTTWTWSGWVKRGSLPGTWQVLFSAYVDGNNVSGIGFNASNQLEIYNYVGAAYASRLITNAVYRDPSSWYHIVVSSNGSSSLNLYVNGVQITSFATTVGPAATNWFYNATNLHQLSTTTAGGVTYYFDGYLAEVNFIDGQALTPSSFGAYNSTTGIWQPIKYSGTYGTNGFYLNFNNNASTTTLGYDTSGNGNNWTTNNISLTAGSTYDSMTDVPTLTGPTASNFPTLNPLKNTSVLSNANLTVGSTSGINADATGTIAVTSGKWYWEATAISLNTGTNVMAVGACKDTISLSTLANTDYFIYANDGTKGGGGAGSVAYGSTYTANDVIGVALDMSAGTITFYKNNVSQGVAFSGLTSFTLTAIVYVFGTSVFSLNFGQQGFKYTPPSGFVALNTYNLPTPTIVNGAYYMAASTYTGNLTGQSITNGGNNTLGITFQPDLVWIKSRSAATDHKLTDSVRGATKALISDTTGAETTDVTGLTAFNSNGFTLGASTVYNNTAATYVAWQWQAGAGSSSSNTNGSITSTVSVNAAAGFSVVTYTGTGAVATVGHGLGIAPKMMIHKARSFGPSSWSVYHASVGAGSELLLNSTAAAASAPNDWNSTAPTSSVITLGTAASTNQNAAIYVAYCWSEVAGFSKFGSYTGNGSTDGTFVYLGFRPRFILIKCSSNSSTNWIIIDTSRDTYNLAGQSLEPNLSAAEYTPASSGYPCDILSNGFKWRDSGSQSDNYSGYTYIYAAFAENPFKNALAR